MRKSVTLGQGFNLLAVLANNTDWKSVDSDLVQRIIDEPSETGKEFTTFLQGGARLYIAPPATISSAEVQNELIVFVIDYSLSIREMITAGGYDWVSDEITAERFPVDAEGRVEYETKLFQFDWNISCEAAVKQIEACNVDNPWQPAKFEHLLAFGARHPDEQRKYPIIALAADGRASGHRRIAFLGKDHNKRCLHSGVWQTVWHVGCRFLAFRKSSGPSVT